MHPTNVAGYRIVESVGRGGMGVVYRARDILLERDVALKFVASAVDSGRADQLIREARVASSLQHPGIVTIYGFIAEGPCIAMEYIHGCTLSSRLAEGGIPLDPALRLGLDMAEALQYAHDSGVIHADLKPANIMLDRGGRAKVLDFGLAHWRLAEELQTLSQDGGHLQRLAGTIPYMSPELLMGRAPDRRSDIFSFGCVLFEILTGRRPFSGDNPAATVNALLNSPPAGADTLRSLVPGELAGLVLRMLEKDPTRRPGTLGEVVVLLRDLHRGERRREALSTNWSLPGLKPRRWWTLLCAVPLGIMLYFFSESGVSERQLRVFIAQPEYYREGEGTALDAVVWSSVINGLHLLGSVQPILYQGPPVEISTPAQLAKLAGTEEWIHIRLQPNNPMGNVQLQRVRTDDSTLLEQVQFSVPGTDIEQSAQAVFSHVLALYKGGWAGPTGYRSFSEGVYRSFSKIYVDLYLGVGNRQILFEELEELIEESPIFPAAEVLAIDLAHDLFSDTGDNYYLEKSEQLLENLRNYHPNPTVVLQREIVLSIDRGEPAQAKRQLDKFTKLSPGDPAALLVRSHYLESTGELEEAVNLIKEVGNMGLLSVGERYRAAALAIRLGDIDVAKGNIKEILKLAPGNTYALGQSGLIELLYGDIDKAISVYDQLLGRKQHRSYLVNKGLALMLKGDYVGARENFVHALELQPEHRVAMLNLADAEMALDHREKAIDLYREILEIQKSVVSPDAYDKMVEAQCLAHLQQHEKAIELTQEALSRSPGDPEIAYQAALVYALAGERKSAAVNMRAALKGGMDKRWFSLPVFSSIPEPTSL